MKVDIINSHNHARSHLFQCLGRKGGQRNWCTVCTAVSHASRCVGEDAGLSHWLIPFAFLLFVTNTFGSWVTLSGGLMGWDSCITREVKTPLFPLTVTHHVFWLLAVQYLQRAHLYYLEVYWFLDIHEEFSVSTKGRNNDVHFLMKFSLKGGGEIWTSPYHKL